MTNIKTPPFWYQDKLTLAAHILRPVAALYQIGHRINKGLQPAAYTSPLPVICVGNAVAGGSGKTPTVLALAALLKKKGMCQRPFILSRGYGGKITDATKVDYTKHTATEVGDEPLLISHYADIIVGKNRADCARLAEEHGADLLIMDDGLFHYSLSKTITLMVIDGAVGFGNGHTIPAGPLREPIETIWPNIDAVIMNGNGNVKTPCPAFAATIHADTVNLKDHPYIAFAGLGRPEKFKQTLEDQGVPMIKWYPFPDHYPYQSADITRLKQQAAEHNARLITTEKDFYRIPPDQREGIDMLKITMDFHAPDDLVTFIKERIQA